MKRKFEYIGAGLFAPYHMGIAIYIRYKSGPNEIRLKEQSPRHVHIICPDRELFIVNDKHYAHPYQPPFDYDEVVNVSPFQPITGSATGITNFMMNYSSYIGKEYVSPKLRRHGKLEKHCQTIFADSGGFQLKTGKFDYISPLKLVEWYNDNVDVGLVLDIPPASGNYWPGLIEKMGKAQSANIDIMLANKRKDLELLNIFHGQTVKDVNEFRKYIERDEIDRTAIGGAYYQTVLQSIDHACRLMTSGKKYKHYHMLGVGNIRQIYAFMRMASKGIADYITSDSSSFLQEAMNKGYFHCPTIDSPPRHLIIGDQYNKPNAGQTLPCSCPVCKSIKYVDVLNSFTGNILAFLLLYHNLFRFTQHCEAMYDVINTATKDDLKALLRSQLETRKFGRDEALACIDYVDDFASGGADYAYQSCQYFLPDPNYQEAEVPSLFGSPQRDVEIDYSSVAEDDPIRVRMERVLDSFITSQSDKHVKVQMDKRIIKTDGHLSETSSFAVIPGKVKRKKKKVEVKKEVVKVKQEKKQAHKILNALMGDEDYGTTETNHSRKASRGAKKKGSTKKGEETI